ncbi:hypothetical protein [New Jersey aster yellows phytoplasma]|nr:hypothetical protein [New Jersey aster yellows phytoplasma]
MLFLLGLKLPKLLKSKQQQDNNEYQYQTEFDDENKLVKDIAVVTLTTGAVVIGCLVLAPIFASVGPIAAPVALLL